MNKLFFLLIALFISILQTSANANTILTCTAPNVSLTIDQTAVPEAQTLAHSATLTWNHTTETFKLRAVNNGFVDSEYEGREFRLIFLGKIGHITATVAGAESPDLNMNLVCTRPQ